MLNEIMGNFLSGQKSSRLAAVPIGMLSALRMSGLSNLGASTSSSSSPNTASNDHNKGGKGWLLPAIIGLVLVGGLFYFMKGCSTPATTGVDKAAEVAATTTATTTSKADTTTKNAVQSSKDSTNKN